MLALSKLLFEKDFGSGQFKVPMISDKLNYLYTDIDPKDRTFKNLPRYANKKPKVRFQDWLEIDCKKLSPNDSVTSWGWGADGKCYGWSHRAVHGFAVNDVVKSDTCGNETGKEYTIKTREQAEDIAKKFADDVS